MDYIIEFLNWLHSEGKDTKTITAYKTSINQFLKWYSGTSDKGLEKVQPIDIKEYLGYMKHTLDRKQATINKSTASLKTFFSFLSEKSIVNENPMTRIKIQKVKSTNIIGEKNISKWLTKEEQERFISYVELEQNEFKRLRNLAIIDLMLYAGLRVAEVEQLKIDDIKVNGDIHITIREGKHGKYANVSLINKYSKNLRQWFKYRELLKSDKYFESPYLFVSERSGKLSSRGIQIMLNKYANLANMDNITPHRFRHSYCKNLANSGASIEVIRRLARHESIQTTAIYIDPSYLEQVQALKKM